MERLHDHSQNDAAPATLTKRTDEEDEDEEDEEEDRADEPAVVREPDEE